MSAIDTIKERLDIVEVISESGVALRKTGRSYLGFCPFHPNTRTPAFTVYPATQSFYCFGCQASGTVFDFVMRQQGLDFRDALQLLAGRAGVELQPRTEEEQQQDQQRTRLLALNNLAARYFNYLLLNHERGQPGRAYLHQRDLAPETVEAFQLGYSLNERTHLLRYLTDRKGYEPEEVEAAGLAIHSEQYGWYDRFRGRLVFPIRNSKGEVVGFGGRALGDVQPKYMNTPQTLLFDKSRVLYGLDLAREAIRSADAAVVVEGYVDVLTAYQHGFRNVVAPLGTALTSEHVGMIKKRSQHVYLALDADAAGRRATLKGLGAFESAADEDTDDGTRAVVTAQGLVRWQRDVVLRIIKLPEGRDPDDVIKHDPQQWQALIDAALPVMDFYVEACTADLDLSRPQDQRAALERLIPLVRQLDSTQQRVYVAQLERVLGMRAELILDLLRAAPPRPRRSRQRASAPEPTPPPQEALRSGSRSSTHPREDYLLALLLRHPSALPRVEQLLTTHLDDLPDVRALLGDTPARLLQQTTNRLIWQAWQEAGAPALPDRTATENGETTPEQAELPPWGVALDETLHAQFAHLVALPLPRQQEYRYVQDIEQCVRHMRLEQTRRWQRQLSQQVQDAEDDEERQRALTLLAAVQTYLSAISAPRRSSSWLDVRDTLRRDES